MSYQYYNPNPLGRISKDCQVRAICKALSDQFGDWEWERVYTELCVQGYILGDVPSSNITIDTYLRSKGFKKEIVEDCPNCMTFGEFANRFPIGTFIVATGQHIACVQNSVLYDSWDSSNEPVLYYYRKLGENY